MVAYWSFSSGCARLALCCRLAGRHSAEVREFVQSALEATRMVESGADKAKGEHSQLLVQSACYWIVPSMYCCLLIWQWPYCQVFVILGLKVAVRSTVP